MYFHLVYSSVFFPVAFGRKSTRKLFHQETKFLVLMDHEFVGDSTSPPFAFPSCPFHMGRWLPFGEAAYRNVLGHMWVRKTQVKILRNR